MVSTTVSTFHCSGTCVPSSKSAGEFSQPLFWVGQSQDWQLDAVADEDARRIQIETERMDRDPGRLEWLNLVGSVSEAHGGNVTVRAKLASP